MNRETIKQLLESVRSGDLDVEKALEKLRSMPYDDLGFAKIDTHRAMRMGFPEVIFCEGKTVSQIQEIVRKMSENSEVILAMRAGEEVFRAVQKIADQVEYNAPARAVLVGKKLAAAFS
jgi:NCAIR mutase (PurE)-related protein